MADYRLQYLSHEIDLPQGQFVIGRGSKCQLTIDDPQVSRRHAVLHVGAEQVAIEDAGSRNATVVNGVAVKGRITLIGGDRIQIGRHELVLLRSKTEDSRDEVTTDARAPAPWFHKSRRDPTPPIPAPSSADESTAPSSMLVDLAEKALAAGNVEEAEWVLGKILAEFHYRASGGDLPTAAQLDAVVGQAIRLSQLTGKIIVLEGLFDVLGTAGHMLRADAVGALEALGRKNPALGKGRLARYVNSMQGRPKADSRLLARLDLICLPA